MNIFAADHLVYTCIHVHMYTVHVALYYQSYVCVVLHVMYMSIHLHSIHNMS